MVEDAEMVVAVAVAMGSVWVPVLSFFTASLAFNFITILSNASFAIVYPSSRPKFIPFPTPSSNFASNFPFKFCSTAFRPF